LAWFTWWRLSFASARGNDASHDYSAAATLSPIQCAGSGLEVLRMSVWNLFATDRRGLDLCATASPLPKLGTFREWWVRRTMAVRGKPEPVSGGRGYWTTAEPFESRECGIPNVGRRLLLSGAWRKGYRPASRWDIGFTGGALVPEDIVSFEGGDLGYTVGRLDEHPQDPHRRIDRDGTSSILMSIRPTRPTSNAACEKVPISSPRFT